MHQYFDKFDEIAAQKRALDIEELELLMYAKTNYSEKEQRKIRPNISNSINKLIDRLGLSLDEVAELSQKIRE